MPVTNPRHSTDVLDAADARAVVRLLGGFATPGNDLVARRHEFMDGVGALVGADSWTWATACRLGPDDAPSNCGFLNHGFTHEQFARFQEALERPATAAAHGKWIRAADRQRTPLTQIDPAKGGDPAWHAAGIAEGIVSICPGPHASQAMVGVYRRPGRGAFLPRETRLVDLLLAGVPWIYETLVPPALGTIVRGLTPRERITLNLLLDGQDRRQVAECLRLSYHTVDGYVKALYQHFHAHSQPGLIARFRAAC